MIDVQGLRKRFGDREVLKGVELKLRPGVITGIAGPNACGKTTLIKCILGLAVPTSGDIRVGGEAVDPDGRFRRRIGYMPQYPDFPSNITVAELFRMLEDIRGERAALRDEMIARLELVSVLKQAFGQLSGGTKQKVAAVAAFMFDAPILILDEPTAGLDPISSLKFKDLLREQAARGKTILLVSHIMSEVEQLAEDLVFMVEGTVIFSGSTRELREKTGETQIDRAVNGLFAIRREAGR